MRSWLCVVCVSACPVIAQGEDPPSSSPPEKPRPAGSFALVNGEEVPIPTIPMGDPRVIKRIIHESNTNSKVMDHLSYLCEQIGPRLTGSTNARAANDWTREQFESWGLANAHVWEWGTIATGFDRGPSWCKVLLKQTKTNDDGSTEETLEELKSVDFTTQAWTSGTSGPVRGHVVRMPESVEWFDTIRGELQGAWVLIPPERLGERRGIRGGRGLLSARFLARKDAREKVAQGTDSSTLELADRVLFEGINGFISTSRDERVWTGAPDGWRDRAVGDVPPDAEIVVNLPGYDYINSRLADGEPIIVEVNADNRFIPGPVSCANTIAEIPGTVWPDQVVIVSAHLDSWNGVGSQGTTDNGTGSSVTMEAARLLMASKARPKRTIRFILWTGEEQGLLGSAAYVEAIKDQLPNVSAVFVDDGGTNFQGGLSAIEPMIPMLAAASAPVNNQFFSTVDGTFLNADITFDKENPTRFPRFGGSDHASFVRAGVPGFFWKESGRADYPHGWHTQFDRLDLAIPEYLRQSAACTAITAYNLACAPTMLPRFEPEEKPAP